MTPPGTGAIAGITVSVKPGKGTCPLAEELEALRRDTEHVLEQYPDAQYQEIRGYVSRSVVPTHLAVAGSRLYPCAAVDTTRDDGPEKLVSLIAPDAAAVDTHEALRRLRHLHPDSYARLVAVVVEIESEERRRRLGNALSLAHALGWRGPHGPMAPEDEPAP